MQKSTYSDTWDLDVIFEGGSHSDEFESYLHTIQSFLTDLETSVTMLHLTDSTAHQGLNQVVELVAKVSKKLQQAGSYINCLQAQDTTDKHANLLRSRFTKLRSTFSTMMIEFDQKLVETEESVWNELFEDDDLQQLHFVLNEKREDSKERLSLEKESLIQGLSVDGYSGWGQLYDLLVAKIKIPFELDGVLNELSVGQAFNKFSSADRNVRKSVFEKWEDAWEEQADVFSETLNHLGGFRLAVYKERGWEEVLKEPLRINRMKKETLDMMWQVISENKQPLVNYLNRKAKLLGLEKMSWYDLDAPIVKTDSKVTYQDGSDFIVDQFSQFGSELTSFTKKAFEESWIEAEDRAGKAPGGFCTSFPESVESRIFMTFSGTPSNVSTLAHELGHAFHQHVMQGVHPLNSRYAMNVAETASTFAETIVADAAVKNAKNEAERLALLEDKLQRSVALLMNIHARFIFENGFYEERKEGFVSADRLNELMENAQKEAYCQSLESYHPSFWSSKLHFYITGTPFYNFPYTFGFLFSLGIYAKALEEGTAFEEHYIALLRDTGSMSVEDLAEKHLGVDLTQKDFWEKAVKLAVSDVEEFLELTEE
ncbi:M3 family oligoendopeptidase [Metabacillus herbersteinensis]|uniref:M3 family oligoendopeptidase n=1 Tax=Metabacillus herbersteinensis TaxID=283816 RepID=A0ABV6GB18_9BACI